MGRDEFEMVKNGAIKRKSKRKIGIFIDGTGLDRATRRLSKKVDLSRLIAGLTSGVNLEVARYYTLVPYEDDARQFSFLEAVERAGLEVIVKRLPPKGVKRQVSMDVHIASDLIKFSSGLFEEKKEESNNSSTKRVATIVCPSRELSYAIFTANDLGVETTLADFGLYGTSDGWKGVNHWVDLSTSETIWR